MGKQTPKPYKKLKEVNLFFSFEIIQPKRGIKIKQERMTECLGESGLHLQDLKRPTTTSKSGIVPKNRI
jgi:hypothetical protein